LHNLKGRNVMERTAILLSGSPSSSGIMTPKASSTSDTGPFSDKPSLDEIQRRYIQYILDGTNGKLSGPGGACEVLGMKRSSLYNRMKNWECDRSYSFIGITRFLRPSG